MSFGKTINKYLLPSADLDGPSRTVIIEPAETPEPLTFPEPEERPTEPVPNREREPVPA
jgi:hypothetical protein